jgi:hypothetical protein
MISNCLEHLQQTFSKTEINFLLVTLEMVGGEKMCSRILHTISSQSLVVFLDVRGPHSSHIIEIASHL